MREHQHCMSEAEEHAYEEGEALTLIKAHASPPDNDHLPYPWCWAEYRERCSAKGFCQRVPSCGD